MWVLTFVEFRGVAQPLGHNRNLSRLDIELREAEWLYLYRLHHGRGDRDDANWALLKRQSGTRTRGA